MITLIVPTYRETEHIRSLLRNLERQTVKSFRTIIVNSNPGDRTTELTQFYSKHLDIREVKADKNDFWTGAVFKGFASALALKEEIKGFLCLNCDVSFGPDFMGKVEKAVQKKPDSLFCCTALYDGRYVKTGVRMKSWGLSLTKHIPTGKVGPGRLREFIGVDMLAGRAMFVPIKTVREIGFPAREVLPHYGGDYEYSARAKQHGYKVYVNTKVLVGSDVKNTGGKSHHKGRGVWGRTLLLFSKRSPNNLLYRTRFVMAVYPGLTKIPGVVSNCAKSIAEVIGGPLLFRLVARHHIYE